MITARLLRRCAGLWRRNWQIYRGGLGVPYMVCEAARFVGDKGDAKASTGTLYVRGHLRGDRGLSARQLVHLTGYGIFK